MERKIGVLSLVGVLGIAAVLGCEPKGSRPGLRLSGATQRELPGDWGFSEQYKEIEIEVHTPFYVPHSVTIWCAAAGGKLYVGARAPESKYWPGWVDRDPNVRVKLGDRLYEVRLEPLADAAEIGLVQHAYATKYQLPEPAEPGAPQTRYWRVEPRKVERSTPPPAA